MYAVSVSSVGKMEYNRLFRRFLDMNLMERSFDPTVFTKNRLLLLSHRVGQQLLDEAVAEAHERSLLSVEHFTVDDYANPDAGREVGRAVYGLGKDDVARARPEKAKWAPAPSPMH